MKPLTIDIVATPDIGHWELSVDGYGSTGIRGEGPASERPWLGTVSGRTKTLPDGKYTLRLTAKGLFKTVEVIIDTQKPVISDLEMAEDPSDPSGRTFLVNAKVTDKGPAGIDETKFKTSLMQVISDPQYDRATGALKFKSTVSPFFAGGGKNSYELLGVGIPSPAIDIRAFDKAGNDFRGGIYSLDEHIAGSIESGQQYAFNPFSDTDRDAYDFEDIHRQKLGVIAVIGSAVLAGGSMVLLADSASAYAFTWVTKRYGLSKAIQIAALSKVLATFLDETGSVPRPTVPANAKYVALDANVIISILEHESTAAACLAKIAGRNPVVSRQAIKEFLTPNKNGKGDIQVLRNFLLALNGKVVGNASAGTIAWLKKEYPQLKHDDVLVLGSAMDNGILLLTQDVKSMARHLPPGSVELP